MKLSVIFCLLITSLTVSAQSGITWDPGINVATAASENLHPRIVVDRSGNPLVMWGKLNTKSVMFSRWDSTMAMFTAPVTINSNMQSAFTAAWAGPDIASYGDSVYIAFKVTPEDTGHMFVAASYDGGMSFDQPVQIDQFVDSISRFPAITTDKSGNPVVGFMKFDNMFMNAQYAVCRSNDFGISYSAEVPASGFSGGNVCDCCPAGMVSSDDTVVMMYRDNLNNNRVIWAGVSTDNAQTFPSGVMIDHTNWMINSCPSTGPDGVIIGDTLYAVYMSGASASRCYLNKTSLSTMISGPDQQLGNTVSGLIQNYPRIAKSGNRIAIVFKQIIGSDRQLALFYSNDITTTPITNVYDTLTINSIENADVVMTDENIYVVWQDNTSGTVKYKKGLLPVIPTNVESTDFTNEVKLYPTLAKDYFTISGKQKIHSVQMFDISGKEIQLKIITDNNNSTCHFEVTAGVYSVRILLENGYVVVKNVIVETK